MKIVTRISKYVIEVLGSPVTYVSEIARDFEDHNIEYAIVGGIAVRVYNYLRNTDDIDFLVSKKTEKNLKKLLGRGYSLRPGTKRNLYFLGGTHKIEIDILVEGDKEGGMVLPNPIKVRKKISGVWYLNLTSLVDFKLASKRAHDIVDVETLIKVNDLDNSFAKLLIHKKKFLNLMKKIGRR